MRRHYEIFDVMEMPILLHNKKRLFIDKIKTIYALIEVFFPFHHLIYAKTYNSGKCRSFAPKLYSVSTWVATHCVSQFVVARFV